MPGEEMLISSSFGRRLAARRARSNFTASSWAGRSTCRRMVRTTKNHAIRQRSISHRDRGVLGGVSMIHCPVINYEGWYFSYYSKR
jgi:hypothetical protein